MEQTEEKKEMKKTIILIIFLIVIVITVIIILCYKQFCNQEPEIKKIPLATQISEYEGENVSGAEVKLMLAKILSEELENSNTSLSKIEYDYKNEDQDLEVNFIEIKTDNKSENVQEIVKLRNLISNEEIYEIKYQKENNAISFISIKIKERN